MRQTFFSLTCALLLTLLWGQSLLAATVRPYKFGFTIEEQQHRAESRDENGIVMGEFGFITADGIYHVTVYATDENGKFRILSMKNFPYAGPMAPQTPSTTTSTQRTTSASPAVDFRKTACSGCFLNPEPKKTDIRPLSQPLSTPAAAVPGEQVTGQAKTHTQTHTKGHKLGGIHSQATFDNVEAVREASIQLAVVAQTPQDLAELALIEAAQAAALSAATTPAPPTTTTTLHPVVVNAQAVALAHAIDKVQGMRPTSRPSPSASEPLPQLLPLSAPGAVSITGVRDRNTFVVDLPLAAAAGKPEANGDVLTFETLDKLERVSPAALGIKDLNSFAFGQLSPKKQTLPLANVKPGQRQSAALTEAQRLNGKVVNTLQELVLPVNGEIAGLVRPQSQASALTATPPRANRITAASPSQFPTFIGGTRPAAQTQTLTAPAQTKTPAHTLTIAHSQPISAQSVQQPQTSLGSGLAGARPAVTGAQQQQRPAGSTGSSSAGKQTPSAATQAQQRPQASASSPGGAKPGSGGAQAQQSRQPSSSGSPSYTPNSADRSAVTATKQPSSSSPNSYTPGASKASTNSAATGDLYKFKYLLDYNGHEETGGRNGDKAGNYFAIDSDSVQHVVEYIANEFGFQPHISWRKLTGKEAELPEENSLKHYEFKWFNKAQ